MKIIKSCMVFLIVSVCTAIGVKLYLDRKKKGGSVQPLKVCLRPVKWKLTVEK